MAPDDLNAPLGQENGTKRWKLPALLPHVVAAALGFFALTVGVWAVFGDDPLGGEPMAVVATATIAGGDAKAEGAADGINHSRYDGPDAPQNAPAVAVQIAEAKPEGKTVTIIDGSSGRTREVTIPETSSGKPARSPADPKGVEPKTLAQELSEPSTQGPIPVIGPHGQRALNAFAHRLHLSAEDASKPRIAIIVTGLGISASGTADAFSKLPAPVTFAIAPYGTDLPALAARASAEDHEVLLQAPMEPFDYPNNDPGPQTLLTSLSSAQNIERLHWLMSRFTGYVGVVGYMGARFTSSDASLSPVMNEIARRGLIYVDDGASARSLAPRIATGQSTPFAKADIVIDAVPTADEIDHALMRLEMMAREHGSAVGIANGLPPTIARIAAWTKGAEGRGFVLVPITMVAMKDKSS